MFTPRQKNLDTASNTDLHLDPNKVERHRYLMVPDTFLHSENRHTTSVRDKTVADRSQGPG